VFVSLYTVLGAVDFYLMRRFARLDPGGPPAEGGEETAAEPAPAY
jgi:cytochrome bd-type quinol oxidase subunit 1